MIHLLELCKNAGSIGISGHVHPDGDCVGSTMGLWQFLKKAYPDKQIDVRIEPVLEAYAFVKGVSEIVSDHSDEQYDVFIVADSVPEQERIGAAYPYFQNAGFKINIDHHITNPGVGDACYIDAGASSASELVADLIRYADPDGRYMDAALAETLYFGIIQDCGVFQYSNTSPKTLQTAAWLIGYGFDFPKLIEKTFYEKTLVQSRLLGYVLQNCDISLNGLVCSMVMSREDMARLHVTSKDFEGVVSQMRYIQGVDVSILLRENEDGSFKGSLRSAELVDVALVCSAFGGGGHVRAAGCTMRGNKEALVYAILDEIKKQL